jgi:ABC-type branched-subunit amino acid transport system ATPase component
MLLEVEKIEAGYGRRTILDGVTLRADSKEIIGIVGPNGAGKSTLLKVIAGAMRAESGTVRFDNNDIGNLEQHERARRGIGYVMQGGVVFSNLTVEENLALAGKAGNGVSRQDKSDHAFAIFHPLTKLRGRRAGLLSAGERQMLAVTMVLMNPNARLLLLDEPFSGLAPNQSDFLMKALTDLRDKRRLSVLLVEQSLGIVLAISQRLYVLSTGSIVAEHLTGQVDLAEIEARFFGH